MDIGTDDGNINVAKLVGIMADIHARLARISTHVGDSTERSEEDYLIEQKELHHNVFSEVEKHLEEQNLIETIVTRKLNRGPFYRVRGTAELIDYDTFIAFIEDYEDLADALKALGHGDTASLEGAQPLSYVIERFYAGRIAVLVSTEEGSVSSILDSEHLTAPIQLIVDNYGRQTHIPITLFGLRVDAAGRQLNPTSEGKRASDMTKAVVAANRSLEAMDRVLRLRGDLHLYPLALYVDFDAPE